MMRRLLAHVLNLSWLNTYIGLYLLSFPVLYAFPPSNLVTGVFMGTGLLIAAVGAIGAVSRYPGISLINVPLGVFLIALPFLFGFAGITNLLVQCIGLGVIVAIVAVVGEATKTALVARTEEETPSEQRPMDQRRVA